MKYFVYIATTQGPVQIQKITEEEADIQSVVCLDGTIEPLPISRSYHDFVKKGTGLIHKTFGHGAFRVDLNNRVDQGNSWQLPMYIAHHLHAQGLLGSGEPDDGDHVIWATGAIKTTDKSVVAVEAVETKVLRSADTLETWLSFGLHVSLLVPQKNSGELEAGLHQALMQRVQDCHYIGVDDVDVAIDWLSKDAKSGVDEQASRVSDSSLPVGTLLTLLFGLVALVAVFYFFLSNNRSDLPADDVLLDRQDDLEIRPEVKPSAQVSALVAEFSQVGDDCAGKTVQIAYYPRQTTFKPLPLINLCQLYVVPEAGITEVIGIAQDTGSLIPLDKRGALRKLRLPRQRDRDRPYFLIMLQPQTDARSRGVSEFTRSLQAFFQQTRNNQGFVSKVSLQQWLVQESWSAQVYTHKLDTY